MYAYIFLINIIRIRRWIETEIEIIGKEIDQTINAISTKVEAEAGVERRKEIIRKIIMGETTTHSTTQKIKVITKIIDIKTITITNTIKTKLISNLKFILLRLVHLNLF